MWRAGGVLIHLVEPRPRHQISEGLVQLIQLVLVVGLVHHEMRGVEPNGTRQTDPRLHHEGDADGYVSMFDHHMRHETTSRRREQVRSLTIVHQKHMTGSLDFGRWTMLVFFQEIFFLETERLILRLLTQGFPVLLVGLVLVPIVLHLLHHVFEEEITVLVLITRIRFLEGTEIIEEGVGLTRRGDEEGAGDIPLLLEFLTHGHARVRLPASPRTAKHEHGRKRRIIRRCRNIVLVLGLDEIRMYSVAFGYSHFIYLK